MLSCLRQPQYTPPRANGRMSIGSDNADLSANGTVSHNPRCASASLMTSSCAPPPGRAGSWGSRCRRTEPLAHQRAPHGSQTSAMTARAAPVGLSRAPGRGEAGRALGGSATARANADGPGSLQPRGDRAQQYERCPSCSPCRLSFTIRSPPNLGIPIVKGFSFNHCISGVYLALLDAVTDRQNFWPTTGIEGRKSLGSKVTTSRRLSRICSGFDSSPPETGTFDRKEP